MEGNWGEGGEEPEGRFQPRGKTGTLKELDEGVEDVEQVVERVAAEHPVLGGDGFASGSIGGLRLTAGFFF